MMTFEKHVTYSLRQHQLSKFEGGGLHRLDIHTARTDGKTVHFPFAEFPQNVSFFLPKSSRRHMRQSLCVQLPPFISHKKYLSEETHSCLKKKKKIYQNRTPLDEITFIVRVAQHSESPSLVF